ncbi:MAG: replication initiation protein [Flavobacteriales bacterium]|nr:replication initiation protein [Flavobacteriales bacterium]
MSNKNGTQITLPFDFKGNDIKPYVQQHWNITFARQKKVSIYAKRIMSMVMAQIKRDDDGLRPYYQFHITDIISTDSERSSYYGAIKKAFDELTDLKWLIEDLGTKRFAYRHLLNTSDIKCGYTNGNITVVLNPILEPYFIALSHYTTYQLKWYMRFSSWYSMRLFELLSAFKDTGIWEVDIDEYRKLMDCTDKYPQTNDLISYTTSEPLIELKDTDVAFSLERIKDTNPQKKGRKAIVGLRFTLDKVEVKKIPDSWYKFSETHTQTLDRLTNRYKVKEEHIVRYAEAIGIKGVKKLLRTWDLKEASDDRINNKEHYCNSVWCKVGTDSMKDV